MIRSNITVARIPPVMTTVPAVIRKALHQHPSETKGKTSGSHGQITGESCEIDSLYNLVCLSIRDWNSQRCQKLSRIDMQTVSEVQSPAGIFLQLLQNNLSTFSHAFFVFQVESLPQRSASLPLCLLFFCAQSAL